MWLWGTLLSIIVVVGILAMLVDRRRGSRGISRGADLKAGDRPDSATISEVKGLEAPGGFGGMVGGS